MTIVWSIVGFLVVAGIAAAACDSLFASQSKKPRESCDGDARKAKAWPDMQPYAMFSLGPTEKPCPDHAELRATVFKKDDPVFARNPVRKSPDCKCRVEPVSPSLLNRLEANGIQDCLAPPVLNENGHRTGQRQKKMLPIKKAWSAGYVIP